LKYIVLLLVSQTVALWNDRLISHMETKRLSGDHFR